MAQTLNVADWSTPWIALLFLAAATVVVLAGTRLARVAEQLAIVTGLGQAVTGALLLGLTTSLSGMVVSLSAAWRGDAELAISNSLGGIAAQTAFLAIADFFHRRANLEHAAASSANMFQLGLLISLLGLILAAFTGPDLTIWHVHPISLLLPAAWLTGTIIAYRTQSSPGWRPAGSDRDIESDRDHASEDTKATVHQAPKRLWIELVALGALVILGGLALSLTAPRIATATGLSQSAVGALFTATVTSLPELITTIAAVRNGALILAVGDIIGGNAFDTLFTAAADLAYTGGSIYHASSEREVFLTAVTVVMSGVLLMGLVGREKHGPGRIGSESTLILILYAIAMATLIMMGNG
jgi:cation:H+ antiporter